MKPGDKVWVFDINTQKVEERECLGVCIDDGNEYWAVEYEEYPSIFLPVGVEVFPTREALCEHYRKIFE